MSGAFIVWPKAMGATNATSEARRQVVRSLRNPEEKTKVERKACIDRIMLF